MDDLISRKDAIDTFKDCAENGVDINGIVDALENLPSAEPEITADGDTISRRALMKEFQDFVRASNNSDFAQTPTWNDAVSLVGSMPSAQPETSILTVKVAPDPEELERIVRKIKDTSVMVLSSTYPDVDMALKLNKAYDDGYETGYLQGKYDWIAKKKGRWNFIGNQMFECTECGVCYTQSQFNQMRVRITDSISPNFCPSCGADMREVTE